MTLLPPPVFETIEATGTAAKVRMMPRRPRTAGPTRSTKYALITNA
jgi:hypothetical protein